MRSLGGEVLGCQGGEVLNSLAGEMHTRVVQEGRFCEMVSSPMEKCCVALERRHFTPSEEAE